MSCLRMFWSCFCNEAFYLQYCLTNFYDFHSFVIDTARPSIHIWYDGNFLHLAVRTFLIICAKFLSGLFCLNDLHVSLTRLYLD